jgi:hypothetical protein
VAADLTLIAIPDTSHNRELAAYKTYQRLFDTDETVYANDGELLGIVDGDERRKFDVAWYERELVEYDWIQIGPLSYYGETVNAVQDYWGETSAVLTRGRIACTMVMLNLPDGEYRRYFTPKRGERGYKRGRWHAPWRRHYRRVERRQNVKRWLHAHDGWIMWAEAW